MDNSEKLATLNTQDTRLKQTKQKHKTKRATRTPPKTGSEPRCLYYNL